MVPPMMTDDGRAIACRYVTVGCDKQNERARLAVADGPGPPAQRGRAGDGDDVRRVVVFATVSLALLMMSVDSTIVATALHALQHGLGTSINWAGWTITAYSLGFVLMLPMSGRLSERFGRRRVFLGSVVVFTAASLCCGFADNIYLLIALRALQAAGGAGFTPSATGIVVDHFGDERDRAVSLFGSIFPIGAMLGPIFGGLFVSYWSWRGVFFANVPIGALLVVLCLRYIPADPPLAPAARRRIDAIGMTLLGIGLLGGMFAITHLGGAGATLSSPLFVVPMLIAVLSAVLFVRHVRRTPEPFIAPRLIYGPRFGPVNLINVVFSGITLGLIALIPLYATNRYGLSALESGTLLTAEGVAAILLSVVGALALRRTGYRPPLYVGCTVIVAGLLMLALHPVGMPAHAWLAIGAFVVGVGSGTINPASRNAGLQLAPERSATIAALRSMGLQIGSITTISIVTAAVAKGGNPGADQAWLFVAFAAVMVASIPLIGRVPEHHGAW